MKPDDGYPKPIHNWDERLTKVDAVTSYENTTYFFSGHQYFVFSNAERRVRMLSKV